MRWLAAALVAVFAFALSTPAAAAVTPSPAASPSSAPTVGPSPSAVPSHSPSPSPSPSPSADTAALAQLKSRIGGDLADNLAGQQRLSAALTAGTAQEQHLNDAIAQTTAAVDDLTGQVTQLDQQITDKQAQVDAERLQVAALARALQRQPPPLVAVARSKSLVDALSTATDLLVAGDRAHRLEVRLRADLDALAAQRRRRQSDLDQQQRLRESLESNLASLSAVIDRQQQVAQALTDLMSQFQSAESTLPAQPAGVTATLLTLLEEQQRNLNAASFEQAWSNAEIGGAAVQVLSVGVPPAGLALGNPNPTGVLTQPFGPTDLWFEPPLGSYPHFHTGVDLAAPLGTPIGAAADGVVTAVGSTEGGYGNYVVIEHGGQVQTLYGHLQASIVAVGQHVTSGEAIGYEGSTGFSTGPHLHFEVRVNGDLVDPLPLIS